MPKLIALCLFSAACSFAALSAPAMAHHGSNGQFDQSKSLTVTGTITKIRFVNPHSYVYFDVIGEDGEVQPWRCELRSASVHRRFGWSKDMFQTGESITITGSPAWREPFGCFTRTVTLKDGVTFERNARFGEDGESIAELRTLKLANGKPNLAGIWVAPPRGPRAAPTRNPGVAAPEVQQGAPEPALPPSGDDLPYQVTEAGVRALDGYTDQDNPRFQCKSVNLIQDWTFDQHVNKIEQYEDVIILRYGFMDLSRTIHTSGKKPDGLAPSRAGYSSGKWDGDTLKVQTDNFEPGFLVTGGAGMLRHTADLTITESFTMSDDGTQITREYEATDPEFISGVYKGSDKMIFTRAPFERYDCEDLTEEIVDGF